MRDVFVLLNGPFHVDFTERFDLVSFSDGVLFCHVVMKLEIGMK